MRLLGKGRDGQQGEETSWWVKQGKLPDRTHCRKKLNSAFKTTASSSLTKELYSAHQERATELTSCLIPSPLD